MKKNSNQKRKENEKSKQHQQNQNKNKQTDATWFGKSQEWLFQHTHFHLPIFTTALELFTSLYFQDY